jgi:polyphenol oxidase
MILRSEALSTLPTLDHGFFTRRGGVSDGAWASLNVGLRGGDVPERVAENRARAAGALGGTAEHLVTARQVHGAVALAVAEPWDNHAAPEADALVTDRPGLILGVLTADCGPVLLADREAGVVGAVHAGWKGAFGGVLETALAAMVRLGAAPRRVTAALGPCIAQSSYEVGPEFVARFAAEDDAIGAFFAPGSAGKARFDLAGYVAARLRRAGVGRIEVLGRDTCAEEDLFFSFRRTTRRGEERFGLQLSAIVLRG